MPIARSELKQYKSETVDDSSLNGGIIGVVPVISGVLNNVFPNVSKAERAAGLATYRKIFIKNTNLLLGLIAPFAWIDVITAADDFICLFVGTNTDTQGDIIGTERKYGCAVLNADILAGVTEFTVLVEDSSLASGNDAIFADADTIRISSKSDIDSGVGNEEELVIDSITTNYLGDPKQILISVAPSELLNNYTVADNTRVMSIYKHPSTLVSSVDDAVPTTASGTFDDTTYPIVTDNIGTTEDSITLTFTSPTVFGVVSDVFGTLAVGSIDSTYNYTNPNFSGSTHFSIPSTVWGGTWDTGETVTFDLHPAAMAIWRKRVVPAGSDSLSGNKTVLVFGGESE